MPFTPDDCKPRSTRWTYLVGLGLLGLAGCVPEDAGYDVDPLTGGQAIPKNKAVAPPNPAVNNSGDLPALPSPQASVSPAASASGTTQSLNPSSDSTLNLRIPGNPAAQNNSGWQKPAGAPPDNQDPLMGGVNVTPVRLQGPTTIIANTVPITPATSGSVPITPNNAVPIISAPVGGARIDTYAQAQEQLAARGVVNQQLRQCSNGVWEFSCAVADPQHPDVNPRFEAKASGENGVAAIRAVIQEIDAKPQP